MYKVIFIELIVSMSLVNHDDGAKQLRLKLLKCCRLKLCLKYKQVSLWQSKCDGKILSIFGHRLQMLKVAQLVK